MFARDLRASCLQEDDDASLPFARPNVLMGVPGRRVDPRDGSIYRSMDAWNHEGGAALRVALLPESMQEWGP